MGPKGDMRDITLSTAAPASIAVEGICRVEQPLPLDARNFPAGWDWATLASSSSVRPMMHTPVQQLHVPANTLPSVLAASPRDRYVFATAAGPQRKPFDCQSTCLWNVAAPGRCHARSMGSGVRVADEAMTSDGTCDRLTTRAPAHTRPTAMLLMLTRCHRLMGQQQ